MTAQSTQAYLVLANKGFSNIRTLLARGDLWQAHEIADSLHNLGDWHSTKISLDALIKDFPTEENRYLLDLFSSIPADGESFNV